MFIPIIHGARLESESMFTCDMFCGRCVESTPHTVHRVLEQEELYFVAIGAPEARAVRACDVCGLAAGLRSEAVESGDPNAGLSSEECARRETDAFLRAHADLTQQPRYTPRVLGLTAVLVVVLACVGWITASLFRVGVAALGLVLGLVPVALFVQREVMRREIQRDLAEALEPKLRRLLDRTGGTHEKLTARARVLRLRTLTPVLESLATATPPRGVYR